MHGVSDLTAQLQAAAMPLCATLDIETTAFSAVEVVMTMAWSEERTTGNGILHGGALMALADSAGAACASLNLPAGSGGTSTIESKTNFLGAVRDGVAIATSKPLHVGSTTIVVETEIRAGARLVAKVTQTQAVLRRR
ncbi:MAG: PaaI family thioesterase [Actinobacteria bacterium]|nr:PaaI family thioesterase [Actinomycetota bacterium]